MSTGSSKGGQPMDTFEDLEGLLQAIKKMAKEQGIHVVKGFLRTWETPVVDWQGGWAEYLELAGLVKTPLLYLQEEPFASEQENASRIMAERPGRILRLDEELQWLSERLMEQTAEWSKYSQQIGHAVCVWCKEGVGHYLTLNTEWYLKYKDAVNEALE